MTDAPPADEGAWLSGLLTDLLDALAVSSARTHLRHDPLHALAERVDALPAETRSRVAQGAFHLRGCLVALGGAARTRDLDPGERRSLRTLLGALGTLVDVHASPSITTADSVVRAPVEYAHLDARALLEATAAAFSLLARERSVSFTVHADAPTWVDADAAKVEVILLNLLFNAFKYAPVGGRVACALSTDTEGHHAVFTVADSGHGIPAAQAGAVFERSRVLDRTASTALKGLGFSLGTSRDLAALHGGFLALGRPPEGFGCMFRVGIPLSAPTGVMVTGRADAAPRLATRVAEAAREELDREDKLGGEVDRDARPLVLLVDDSRSMQRVVVDGLGSDYATASAFDGVEGLNAALRLRPDLVLCDLEMPRLDGEGLVRALRAHSELADIPVLVLTAEPDPARLIRLLDTGAQDVLHKPFLLPELRARVNGLVAAKRARDILRRTSGRHEANILLLAREVASQQARLETALDEVRVARDQAQRANRIKSNFLRMMSHELKTPVTSLLLHMRILEQDAGPHLSPRQQDGMVRMARATRRLLHLVDTVMEWARVESGRAVPGLRTVDAVSLVRAVAEEYRVLVRDKSLELDVSVPDGEVPLQTDERMVRLVVSGMLAYAVQCTARGRVAVGLRAGPADVTVSVRDGAPTIPPELGNEVFLPFETDEDLRWRAGSGSGLGLYVLGDIARALGGTLELAPADGAGNQFLLRLPRSLGLPVEPRHAGKPAPRMPRASSAPALQQPEEP